MWNMPEGKCFGTNLDIALTDSFKKAFGHIKYFAYLRTAHGGPHGWPCGRCDRGFDTITELRTHIREERCLDPLSCVECEFTALTRRELGDHTRSHTLEKPSQCQICRRGFRKKSTSGQHEKLKLCGEFSCPKPGYGCPEGYPERNELVLGDIYVSLQRLYLPHI